MRDIGLALKVLPLAVSGLLGGCGETAPPVQPPMTLTEATWGCYQWVKVSEALATFPGAPRPESRGDALQRERFYRNLVELNILSEDEVKAAVRDARGLLRDSAAKAEKVQGLVQELHRATDACEEDLLRRRSAVPSGA